jgi:glycosyltransferase involved in cell wall biosynthesis
MLDSLWAEDLKGLVKGIGPVTVAAPELKSDVIRPWGPSFETLSSKDEITFLSLPHRRGWLDLTYRLRLHQILRDAVVNSDIVHSSNLFRSDTSLYYAHDLAVRMKKKTLFVVAEDFYDMQFWEWIRTKTHVLKRWRTQWVLRQLDRQVRKRVRTSSLTFLHTPAAVARYRLFATNAVAIRQPMHERQDVISADRFAIKCDAIRRNEPLVLCAACRMESLKGIDFVVRAVSILKQRGIFVRAILYGNGRRLASFKDLAERLDVSDRVEFPGALAPASVLREALANGHVFLMPHLTSDFGRAFFDGLVAGSPVIAFRSLASEDTVRHGVDGLITPNADDEGLADGIARFHFDREMLIRSAQAARARALENTKTFWNAYRAQMIRGLFEISATK